MLSQELQKDINIEIEKADEYVKSFLLDKYFRDTIDLIIKVNKLNPDQAESVELETILHILNISDYENIEDGIKNECSIENEQTVIQVVKDLQDYILKKLGEVPQDIKVISNESDIKPLRNIIQDAYGKDIMGPVLLDYYNDKRLQENIIDTKSEQTNKEVPLIVSDVMHDVYREMPAAEDTDAERIKNVKN